MHEWAFVFHEPFSETLLDDFLFSPLTGVMLWLIIAKLMVSSDINVIKSGAQYGAYKGKTPAYLAKHLLG